MAHKGSRKVAEIWFNSDLSMTWAKPFGIYYSIEKARKTCKKLNDEYQKKYELVGRPYVCLVLKDGAFMPEYV